MSRQEIENNLLKALSIKDVSKVFKDHNISLTEKAIMEIFVKIRLLRKDDGDTLSEDELMSVNAGRDYVTEGCAATVEPGSDCWGVDGGCTAIHYSYDNKPTLAKCDQCGNYMYIKDDQNGNPMVLYRCRYCGYEVFSWRPGYLPE